MPTLVVLPAPLTPTTMITVGVCSPITSGRSSGCEQLLDAARQQAARGGRVAHVGAGDAALQVVEKIDGRVGAGVRLEQRNLEVFVERVADLGADEGAGDRAARALQAGLQLGHPAGAIGAATRRLAGDDVSRGLRRRGWRRGGGRCRRRLDRLLAEKQFADVGVQPVARAARTLRAGDIAGPGRDSFGAGGDRVLWRRRDGRRRALAKETEHAKPAGQRDVWGRRTALQGRSVDCESPSEWLAILAASGALAQSVRATES